MRWQVIFLFSKLKRFIGWFLIYKCGIKIGETICCEINDIWRTHRIYLIHFLDLNVKQHLFGSRWMDFFKLDWKINVQKSAQIISIWLDEFLQSEHTHVTIPQDAYVLIGKGEKNLATVHQKKKKKRWWYWLIVWNTLWGCCGSS